MDSCSSENFISDKIVKLLSLKTFPFFKRVTMTQKSVDSRSNGFVILNFKLGLNDKLYTSVRLTIIKDLSCDVVLGREYQHRYLKVTFEYGDQLPEVVVKGTSACFALEAANIVETTLFPGISTKCKPIATKSRCFNKEDSDFIAMEIGKLQKDEIIEPSMSPRNSNLSSIDLLKVHWLRPLAQCKESVLLLRGLSQLLLAIDICWLLLMNTPDFHFYMPVQTCKPPQS